VSVLPKGSVAALDPVRQSLQESAKAQAEQVRVQARSQVEGLLAKAKLEAQQIRDSAAAEGEAAANSDAGLRSARVRRQAHEIVLAQQESLRLELVRQVRQAATALRKSPEYPRLMKNLTERVEALLGSDAIVEESPHGGVIAREGSRRVDLSLPTLAEQILESRGQEIRKLWAM